MKKTKGIKKKFFERNRIIILFTPLVLLPVVILSVIIISIYIEQTEIRNRTSLQNSITLVTEEIGDIFENTENCSNIINLDINHSMSLLKYEFNEKIMELKLENSIKTTLDLYKSMFKDIESINYIDSKGNIISTELGVRKSLNVDKFLKEADISGYKDEFFLKWLDMKKYDVTSGEERDLHISLIRPVLSLSNLENRGYIVINISGKSIEDVYVGLNNGFFITNDGGEILNFEDISAAKDKSRIDLRENKNYLYENISHRDINWYLVSEYRRDIMSKEASLVIKNMLLLMSAIMFICICIGKAFSDRQIRDVERRKRKYELDIIQAQIKPHFLYNSLDLIYVLCAMEDVEGAKGATKALADFYRLSLSGGDDIVSLKDELNNVENYLKIQSRRYSDKFDFKIDVENEILAYKIPKLILQPLVENSIYHGLKPGEKKGTLMIFGKECGKYALMCVEDSGVGISNATIDMILNSSSKRAVFGLKSIMERMDLYYETSGNEIKNEMITRDIIMKYASERDNIHIISKHMAIQSREGLTRVFLVFPKG